MQPTNMVNYYPLTNAQKMFWVNYKLNEDATENNVVHILNITGRLNADNVQKSYQHIVDKHEALRTNIIENADGVCQVIRDSLKVSIATMNCESEKNASNCILNLASKNFKLESDPLINLTLIKINSQESRLVFVVHHIVTDGISMEILSNDFISAYNSFENGLDLPNDNQKHFSDFVLEEQEFQDQAEYERMRDFWIRYLEGSPPSVDMPTDFLKIETTSRKTGNTVDAVVNNELQRKIRKTAKDFRVTPFQLLFSLFNIYIHRISGQKDIVIGTPVNIRPERYKDVVGPFINTIALRSRIEENLTLRDYLDGQKTNFLEVFKNFKHPFNQVVDDLKITRSYGENPIFNIMFDYYKESTYQEIDGIAISSETTSNRTSKFDLTFSVLEKFDKSFVIKTEYSNQLYKSQSVQRLLNGFITLLESVCEDTEQEVSKISLVSKHDRDTILNIFNDTDYVFDCRSFIEIFEQNVDKSSNSIAVKFGDKTINYADLNKKANSLARHLRKFGVDQDTPVGVLLERSIELIISIVAIWKSGGVYVPIETEYPSDRIKEMTDGAKIQLVISKEQYNFLLKDELTIINLDQFNYDNYPNSNLNHSILPSSLAYIIFTSGSTSTPKGVMIEHSGMMNHLFIMIDYFDLSSESRIAQNASHCFDISIWQLVCSLLVGATTVIYSKDVVLDPLLFLKKVNDDGITILEVVPTFLNTILEFSEVNSDVKYPLEKLQYLLPTGEAVKPSLIRKWFQIYPNIPITNAYGPAEASDDTNFYLMTKPPSKEMRNVPVGKPLKNIKVYIVDQNLDLCPIGVYGEICISGISVGRGYVNNLLKTQESFTQDPFNTKQNTRLYKTGDIGRWLEDGNIEFVGRRDFQVKVNGFRIELEEIESRLVQFPAIKEAVVMDLPSSENSKILVAYYTSTTEIETQELRNFLLAKLPSYMVPSLYVHLQVMPLNNSGKIDRKSLPKPVKKQTEIEEQDKTSNEKAVIEVWGKILKLENISLTDNFFEIGGDSIKSIQSVSLLREMGFEISVKDIFIHQTVRELAKQILANTKKVKTRSVEGIFSLSPIQKDLFLQDLANVNYYHQGFCFDIKAIDANILTKSFELLVERHESLRLRFSRGTTISQQYTNEYQNILSFFKLSNKKNIASNFKDIVKEICEAINIENGPVIKAALVQTPSTNKLFIVVHHLCIDYISWNFLFEDLENIYLHLKNQTHKLKPIKSSTYKDWVEKLTGYAQSETIEKYIPFWEKQLSTVNKIVPTTKDGEVNNSTIIRTIISQETTRSILDFTKNSKKLENTLLMLTASAISQFSDNRIVSILLEKHGRVDIFDDIDISGCIGWFTSLFPIVLDFSVSPNNTDKLTIVNDTLKNIPNDGIDYGVLRYMREKSDVSKIRNATEPQIIFNYLGDISSSNHHNLLSKRSILAENLSDPNNNSDKIEIDIYQNEKNFIVEIRFCSNFYELDEIKRFEKIILKTFTQSTNALITESENQTFDLINISSERLERIKKRFA